MSSHQEIDKHITLEKSKTIACGGFFPMVVSGQLTQIVHKITESGQVLNQMDIWQYLEQKDHQGSTPVDIACFLNNKNILVFLLSKTGSSKEAVLDKPLNIDQNLRNCYHLMCFKGNAESLALMLNFERECLKKYFCQQLCQALEFSRLKSLDIIDGKLTTTKFFSNEDIKQFLNFSLKATSLFEEYTDRIVKRYEEILYQNDKLSRNPLHYVAMNKYTLCYRTLQILLDVKIDDEPEYQNFLKTFFDISGLDDPQMKAPYDPRKYHDVVSQFKNFLPRKEFKQISKKFNNDIFRVRKTALMQKDINGHTPLHIASYFGDFKASRLMVDLGARPTDDSFQVRPLEVSKDKFSRSVLQNLHQAANQANPQDLAYLVNCGNNINQRESITGEAPIHRAVLSKYFSNKIETLKTIIECNANIDTFDSNGWTALMHAAYNGDIKSVQELTKAGAKVNLFSNQLKSALHFAALKNRQEIIQHLLSQDSKIESRDDLGCTPLHLACKKGCEQAVQELLNNKANIYAKDDRDWTPLHYASYNGYPKICKLLLTFSVDEDPKLRDCKNSQNKTAFNICKNPQTKLGFQIIWRAAKMGDLDMVRILLREGQDINQQTQFKRNTPLHLAADGGHVLIVKFLIDQRADKEIKNDDGKTPLDLAIDQLRSKMPEGSKKPQKGSLEDRLQATVNCLSERK